MRQASLVDIAKPTLTLAPQFADVQDKIRRALTGLPFPESRLDEFDNCRELWRQCQCWLSDIDEARLAHNQAY
ncbi:hypothetical protein, partial [Klebsiella aerogenes]|uniref:hypothetical protein n=1 Tax=Klebsiella aerogenes TaxID=548 RepID=UPI000A4B1766